MSLGADTDLLGNWGKSLCPLAPVSCSVDGALLASIHKWEKAADKALRQVCPVLHSCLPSLDCFENDYSKVEVSQERVWRQQTIGISKDEPGLEKF